MRKPNCLEELNAVVLLIFNFLSFTSVITTGIIHTIIGKALPIIIVLYILTGFITLIAVGSISIYAENGAISIDFLFENDDKKEG